MFRFRAPFQVQGQRFVSASVLIGAFNTIAGQDWTPVASFDAGLFSEASKVSIARQGELLVLAVAHPGGGLVEAHQRHEGGLDQWGTIASEQSAIPWFGSSIALRNDLLAVGSPAAAGAGPYTGEVRLYNTSTSPGSDLLELQEVLASPEQASNDRFGYSLLWLGDTLAASAVSRATARSIGTVFLFTPEQGSYAATPPMALLPERYPVPFIRWFGAALATGGGKLAIAAPYSGFEATNDQQNIGSLHLFQRDAQSPSGWSIDTAWANLALDTSTSCAFDRMELGRWGAAFVDGGLLFDHAKRYSGSGGTVLEPWTTPSTGSGTCPACRLRAAMSIDGTWDLEGATVPSGSAPPLMRGALAWCASGDTLLISSKDPGSTAWSTAVHRRDQGGPWAWGYSSSIADAETCDELSGPMLLSGQFFIRVSMQRGQTCSVPDGMVRVKVEVFEP